MVKQIEYFYAPHSAFAYLGARRLYDLAAAHDRVIAHRPVDLSKVVAAVYPNGFAGRSKAHYAYYFGREVERWSEYRSVRFKGGVPPSHGNDIGLANRVLIGQILAGTDVAELAFAFMRGHWNDFADLSDPATLEQLIASVGLDAQDCLQAADSRPVAAQYDANTDEAIARSVFGSPTYFVDGDMFYGQDRLELVERALIKPFAGTWPKT